MDIKKATQLAVWGVGISFMMSLFQTTLFQWLASFGGFSVYSAYSFIHTALHDGSLLLFFVTLRKAQTERDAL